MVGPNYPDFPDDQDRRLLAGEDALHVAERTRFMEEVSRYSATESMRPPVPWKTTA
jgi:hypothetical protein